jgi:hypothetical protein
MTFGERKPLRSETDLRVVAEQQFGVFRHAQAAAAGIPPAGITRRIANGAWERVLPKV